MYDIILQNNASREFFLLSGMTDTSDAVLYLKFEEVDLPIPDGEYTYAVYTNNGTDTTYEFNTPLLDTVISFSGGSIVLRDLNPLTGLLMVGKVEDINIYDEGQTTYPYESGNNNGNLYYEG